VPTIVDGHYPRAALRALSLGSCARLGGLGRRLTIRKDYRAQLARLAQLKEFHGGVLRPVMDACDGALQSRDKERARRVMAQTVAGPAAYDGIDGLHIEADGRIAIGGVKVKEARRHAARSPPRERRSMPRERATRPWQQIVSACRLAL
jgi:hypothetical protein